MTIMESIYNAINIIILGPRYYVFYGTNKFNPLREFVNTQTPGSLKRYRRAQPVQGSNDYIYVKNDITSLLLYTVLSPS